MADRATWMLQGRRIAGNVRYGCEIHGVWQIRSETDVTWTKMTDSDKYGCYMHGIWHIGSDVDVTWTEDGR